MKTRVRRIGMALLVLIVGIQFLPNERPLVSTDNPNDIHNDVLIDPEVVNILKAACYDCHSNETVYPWYAGMTPVNWLVHHDVEEGRHELNFSEWATYSEKRKHHKLEELIEEVEEGKMPLPVYTITHRDARLSETQKKELLAWAKDYMTGLNPEE